MTKERIVKEGKGKREYGSNFWADEMDADDHHRKKNKDKKQR